MTDAEFLSEVEKDLVQRFYEDVPTREAVKKILLDALYHSGIIEPDKPVDALHNAAFMLLHQDVKAPNEQVGARLRAMYEGLLALEAGFEKMSQLKKVEPDKPKVNKAR